jgi:transcriptional regulator with XRE-family HTH domain
MKVSGRQISAARDLLGLTQVELAKAAGVGESTVLNFELGKLEPHQRNREKIQTELERRGIEFTNGDGIGVRLNNAKAAEYAKSVAQARPETR